MRRRCNYVILTVMALFLVVGVSGVALADEPTTTTTTTPATTSTTQLIHSTAPTTSIAPTTSTVPARAAIVVPELPRKSGLGRRIVYANKRGQVWAVDANNKVIRTFLVSGRQGVPKPGNYKVFSQSALSFSLDLEGVTFRFMTRFAIGPGGGNIGFHEIPLRHGKPMQTVDQLGKFLSEGCLRSATLDAIFIFNWAKAGTPVIVVP